MEAALNFSEHFYYLERVKGRHLFFHNYSYMTLILYSDD